MEKSTSQNPNLCPYLEVEAQDPAILWCKSMQSYVNIFRGCTGDAYKNCGLYTYELTRTK